MHHESAFTLHTLFCDAYHRVSRPPNLAIVLLIGNALCLFVIYCVFPTVYQVGVLFRLVSTFV